MKACNELIYVTGFAKTGLIASVCNCIPVYELTGVIVSATKTLLAPSVSSGGYTFSTRNLQAVKEKSSCQH